MRFEFAFVLGLLLLCSFLACCAPAGASSLKRSALLALEGNLQAMINPSFGHSAAEDEAESMRPLTAADGTPSAGRRGAASRPPAAALRKRITPYQSRKIAARQQFRCAICHKPFSESNLWDIDHVIPLHLCQGNREECNDLSNLRAIHRTCHIDVTAQQFGRR